MCLRLLNYTIISLALVSYLRSSVVRALHRHRKDVGSIPAGGPIVDEFFSTVPGWFFDMCTIQLEPKTHYPSVFILLDNVRDISVSLLKAYNIALNLAATFTQFYSYYTTLHRSQIQPILILNNSLFNKHK